MSTQIPPRDWQLLSEYVDNQLNAGARARLERRLERDPELRAALESLQRVRSVLRSAALHKAPRSFVLTPSMLPARRGGFSWIPVFGVTSVLAAILLVVSFVVQWLPAAGAPMAAKEAAAPAEMVVAATAETEVKPTPVIVYWGAPPLPPYDLGRGGMGGGGGGAPEIMGFQPTSLAPGIEKVAPPTESRMQAEPDQSPGQLTESAIPMEVESYATEGVSAPAEPPLETTPAPFPEATEMPMAALSEPTSTPAMEGALVLSPQPGGPILGIAKGPTQAFFAPEAGQPAQRVETGEQEAVIGYGVAELPLIRIVLAAVAVLTGLTALILRFSRKS